MTLDEKISQLEKKLAELSSPPIAIEHTAVEIGSGICEKHGEFEQRNRYSTGPIKFASRPSECPECMRDELIRLQAEKIKIDEESRKRNVEFLLNNLDIPERFKGC
ncbi:ATP-binding protein, partial [Escherichia coli]